MQPLRVGDLLPLTLEPNWADLDPAQNTWLCVDMADLQAQDAAVVQRLVAWLQRQPVPVVGFAEAEIPALSDGVDLVVEGEQELATVAIRIDKNPNASAVLVQVLRAGAALNIAQALALESLAYATLQGGQEFAAWLRNYQTEHPHKASRAERESPVLLSREGGGLQIVLNSPEDRNALSRYMRDALTQAFKLVAMDSSIGRVDVSANGPCFSAGGDLSEFGTAQDLALAHRTRMARMPAQYLAGHAQRYTFHVHRACIGAGIEMPAFAGRIVATADSVFQLPEVNMGLIPGAGGCVSIPRRIGRQRTALLAILGEPIPAQRALAWGLIDAIED
jgi:enoyl-CoA hydratase